MKPIYAIHRVEANSPRLAAVMLEMQTLGAPRLRVVDCGDHYVALEGSHRLEACHRLDLVPSLTVLEQDDMIDVTQFDWFDPNLVDVSFFHDDALVSAEEAAGMVYSSSAVMYRF